MHLIQFSFVEVSTAHIIQLKTTITCNLLGSECQAEISKALICCRGSGREGKNITCKLDDCSSSIDVSNLNPVLCSITKTSVRRAVVLPPNKLKPTPTDFQQEHVSSWVVITERQRDFSPLLIMSIRGGRCRKQASMTTAIYM